MQPGKTATICGSQDESFSQSTTTICPLCGGRMNFFRSAHQCLRCGFVLCESCEGNDFAESDYDGSENENPAI